MTKKLQSIEVEEKLKVLGLVVFTPQEFQGVFGVANNGVRHMSDTEKINLWRIKKN